jgi:RNA polymerase primary sigma factor
MIFREVVLWQGRLEDVSAKYRVPHTIVAALDEQLRTLLHPSNERGPVLQREYQGALEAEYLVREWLLTPPTRDSEDLVPAPLRFINGQEVTEGLNDALCRARSYALLREDTEAEGTGADFTEDQADDTHETDQEDTVLAEDDTPLQVLLQSTIFVQEYNRLTMARAMLKNTEVELLRAARAKNERISQDELTIINSRWNPKGDDYSQPDYHKHRVLPLDEQQRYQSEVISAREKIKDLLLKIPELQKLALNRLVTVLTGGNIGRYFNVPTRTLQRDYKERLQPLVPRLLAQLARLEQANGLDEAKNIAGAGVSLFEKIDFQPRFYNELQALLSVAVHNPGSLEVAHKGRFESPDSLRQIWNCIATSEALRQFYKNTLQEHNLRLVVSIARKYHGGNRSFSLDDLIHEGSLGLSRAIDKFSLEAGARLTTYATWWIRQYITHKIMESVGVIHLPAYQRDSMSAIRKALRSLLPDFGSYSRIPNEQLAAEAGLSVDTVKMLLPFMSRAPSLNSPLGHDSESTYESFLTSDSGQGDYKKVEKRFARHEMGRLLHLLEPREQDIVILRAGLGMLRVLRKDGRFDFVESPRDVGVSLTLTAVSKVLSVTRERVRQVEGKAEKVLAEYGERAVKAAQDARQHLGVIEASDRRLQLFTSQLNLEKRIVNFLQENDYLTVAQLLAVQPQVLGRLANLGSGSARKILTALEQIGFSWQGDHWLDTTIL